MNGVGGGPDGGLIRLNRPGPQLRRPRPPEGDAAAAGLEVSAPISR